jgi:hypothetical protein
VPIFNQRSDTKLRFKPSTLVITFAAQQGWRRLQCSWQSERKLIETRMIIFYLQYFMLNASAKEHYLCEKELLSKQYKISQRRRSHKLIVLGRCGVYDEEDL